MCFFHKCYTWCWLVGWLIQYTIVVFLTGAASIAGHKPQNNLKFDTFYY